LVQRDRTKGSITLNTLWRYLLVSAVAAVGALTVSAPAWADTGSTALSVHATSATTKPTTPGTVTFSGARNNPTPFEPSAQPIYAPQPVTASPPPASPASDPVPRYEAATSAHPTSGLAYTGSEAVPISVAGGGAVLTGLALVALSRRRQEAS
jgi:LPXTG-motif cell wall-anchored protein